MVKISNELIQFIKNNMEIQLMACLMYMHNNGIGMPRDYIYRYFDDYNQKFMHSLDKIEKPTVDKLLKMLVNEKVITSTLSEKFRIYIITPIGKELMDVLITRYNENSDYSDVSIKTNQMLKETDEIFVTKLRDILPKE